MPYLRMFFFLFAPLSCAAFAGKTNVLIYADAGYPPYSYIQNGKPAGIYYDVISAVLSRFDSKYSIQIKPLEWNQAIEAVKNGEAFAVYPPYRRNEGRPWMEYSLPIFTEDLAVFCNSSRKKWPDEYSNSKLAINYGFIYPPFVTKLFQKYHMRVFALKDNAQALEYYHKKKVDCYLNDMIAVLYTNKNLKYPYIHKSALLYNEKAYLGYSKDFKEQFDFTSDFINQFNTNLLKIKKEHVIDKIIDTYIYSIGNLK